jgi:hypothetical protein
MSSFGKFLVMIAAAGALGSAHAVERDRVADALPAWSIAAPDLFVYDSGVPEHAGYRPAGATTVKYPAAERSVGLKRAPGAAAARSERPAEEAVAAAPATPESTDWMLLLSGIVVAGFMARRRTRDVAG